MAICAHNHPYYQKINNTLIRICLGKKVKRHTPLTPFLKSTSRHKWEYGRASTITETPVSPNHERLLITPWIAWWCINWWKSSQVTKLVDYVPTPTKRGEQWKGPIKNRVASYKSAKPSDPLSHADFYCRENCLWGVIVGWETLRLSHRTNDK